MGRVTAEHLYNTLFAANTNARSDDPAARINEYLIANNQWTTNVRQDSGQPEGWRDYQQVVSELALIYSVKLTPQITLTPMGLAILDRSMGFYEVMTIQALRFQYPNGHHLTIGTEQRAELQGTPFANVPTLPQLQQLTGVQIRPAVLVWRVLRRLAESGNRASLSVDEFESYLMRCTRNEEWAQCADALIAGRGTGVTLPLQGGRQRRNAQDWIKFLDRTSIFSIRGDRNPTLEISPFGNHNSAEMDEICDALELPETFWQPGTLSDTDKLRWYAQLGGVDLSIPDMPPLEPQEGQEEFRGIEEEDFRGDYSDAAIESGTIELRPFQGLELLDGPPRNPTVEAVYSAELTTSAHRLHDQMVLLVAQTCIARGAAVFEDRDSVDLLVQHLDREFIVEVKSVTPKNFIKRLRYALGQVLHYDFLRSRMSEVPRRKVIAFAAQIPRDSWSITFLNDHLDTDLIALDAGALRVHSNSPESMALFG